MRRRARRSAGADVLGESYRLLDDLLSLEQQAFGEIDRAFVESAPVAARLLVDRPLDGLLADGVRWQALTAVAEATVGQARTAMMALVDLAAQEAIDSVGVQLEACESTLRAKYAGVAAAGKAAALAALPEMMDDVASVLSRQLAGLGIGVQLALRDRVMQAWQAGVPMDWVAVFDPERKPMAAWFHPTSDLKLMARTVEFDVLNAARSVAIGGFNDAAGG